MNTQAKEHRFAAVDAEEIRSLAAATVLVACVLFLVGLGILALISIGMGQANPFHYPLRQSVFVAAGCVAAVFTARMPAAWWKSLLPWIFIATVVLLIMARLVGRNINGAHRWLSLGPISFQPSELGKLTAVLWLSCWLSHHRRHTREFLRGFLYPFFGLAAICVLVLIGPDFGTTALIGGVGLILMFIAGTRFSYLLCTLVAGGLFLGVLALHDPIRLSRITSFLHPEKYQSNESYQLMNSLHAFMEGGGTGVGVGRSLQKFSYLPEAHTDFIMAIIAEETGALGSLVVLGLFMGFFVSGMTIGWRCTDPFDRLVAYGITLSITMQALMNIAVVTASMPTKGLPLPFISHGGSNLVFMLAMVGILLRIAGGSAVPKSAVPAKDSRHWL
ncbi:MAG: putative lipid II flippase FtsW [Verrucomicrobia bacterium]|nr:putative lipid II flippase FtsW [Verrucomicrobiota bacterium]MCH8510881.1 putative lipid II flippase FtsW [Kiritimatiellia bacterium]